MNDTSASRPPDALPRHTFSPSPNPTPPATDDRPLNGWGAIADALLKDPNRIVSALTGRAASGLLGRLTALALLGMAAYGVVVGLFPGGLQWVAVPLKLTGGLFAAALICWPSLYILLCLSGARQSALEVFGLLAASLALLTLLMAGFAPVAWLFAQSTHSASALAWPESSATHGFSGCWRRSRRTASQPVASGLRGC